ncbi:MAG: sigma-70 family RNA polymerase sigma factor [Betaproteobacteria bacterium]|nr:sigma-70 family RNA polymerase sigma factor [Betaproteobacteria bacterium]
MNGERIIPHLPGLRRYARLLTGDPHRADDLVQDALLRACAKWTLWRPASDLRAWLFTVMHNVFINQLRAAPPASVQFDDLAEAGHSEDPAVAIDLQRALARLPDDQREVLLMVTVEDFSYADVARVTGVPVGTVMSRLSRARRRLREAMEGSREATDARSHLKVMK